MSVALTENEFNIHALELYEEQLKLNEVYSRYCSLLSLDIDVESYLEMPLLPIQFFKSEVVKSGNWKEEGIFRSSGTTDALPSKHYIKSLSNYRRVTEACFQFALEDPAKYCHLGLLPSYETNPNSSLLSMVDHFISLSPYPYSSYCSNHPEMLINTLRTCNENQIPTVLWAVSYAILDFIEKEQPYVFANLILVETGGMKGMRKEITREELHGDISGFFGLKNIWSEYGMCELMSQVYAPSRGRFIPPPWMKVRITDPGDPFAALPTGRTGQLGIIDFKNGHSCPFIQTDDLGKLHADGSFEVLGRMDNSDIRGCNLLTPD